MWTPVRETKENMERRAKLVLDRIFEDNLDDICAPTSCSPQTTNVSAVL